ncbi:hypothetical protein [Mycobacterium sp. SA01]|uniref:hypothetical protein n=1 Tax=Mycobacterium sp. SA01 TaxID=3238820 RepID=UPI00351AC9A9
MKPIENWLSGLDYDLLSELMDSTMDVAEETFAFRDWEVRLVALPVNEQSRGYDGRLIGLGFHGVRVIDEESKIRTVLRNKGRRYGSLNEPLVVALLSWSSWTNEREMVNALFGSVAVSYVQGDASSAQLIRERDGYWRPPPSTRGTRIAGVLFADSTLKPWWVGKTLPNLWLNPWAPIPVSDNSLPFAVHTAKDNGNVVSTPAATTPQQLFSLPEPWSDDPEQ